MAADFWPWQMLQREAAYPVSRLAPLGGHFADYMCGTGSLLEEIRRCRPDLHLVVCDISAPFVDFARSKRPAIPFVCQDALLFAPQAPLDIAICTGGIHHLREPQQVRLMEGVSKQIREGGVFIIGEEVLGAFVSDDERLHAVSTLHDEIRSYFARIATPRCVLEAAESVFYGDLHRIGEYKDTKEGLLSLVGVNFEVEETIHVWPTGQPHHGDIILVCRNAKRGPLRVEPRRISVVEGRAPASLARA